MPEGDQQQGQQQQDGGDQQGQQQGGQQSQDQGQKPPWEANGEQFDAQRAWSLIQSLRQEKQSLSGERDQFKQKVTEFEQSQMTEQQKLETRATDAETRAATAETQLARMQVALDSAPEGMPLKTVLKLAGRIAGSTPEEMQADAKELFAEFAGQSFGDGDGGARRTAPVTDMNALLRQAAGRG